MIALTKEHVFSDCNKNETWTAYVRQKDKWVSNKR